MPSGEQWQFEPGDRVECAIRKLPDGSSGLVVTSVVPIDPEERSTKVIYAIFGGIVGAIAGCGLVLWIDFSLKALLVGAVVGAVVFGACSVRWGDSAWETLGRWM